MANTYCPMWQGQWLPDWKFFIEFHLMSVCLSVRKILFLWGFYIISNCFPLPIKYASILYNIQKCHWLSFVFLILPNIFFSLTVACLLRNLNWISSTFSRRVHHSLRSKNDSVLSHICTLSQLHMDSSKQSCLQ